MHAGASNGVQCAGAVTLVHTGINLPVCSVQRAVCNVQCAEIRVLFTVYTVGRGRMYQIRARLPRIIFLNRI